MGSAAPARDVLALVPSQAPHGPVPGFVVPAVIGIAVLFVVVLYVRRHKEEDDRPWWESDDD